MKLASKLLAILAVLLLLTSAVSAAKIKEESDHLTKGEVGCSDGSENIKEEIVGLTDDGGLLVKTVISHPKEPKAKQSARQGTATTDQCYGLLGMKWTGATESYVINPSNPYGISSESIRNAFTTSAQTWDVQTSKVLFTGYSIENIGYGYDNKNTLLFGAISDSGIIAQTSIWSVRRGKTASIVEYDIIFNTNGFTWGNSTIDGSSVMDMQNIATHELGHAIGLKDLYSSACNTETMYGYSWEGDVQKRDLNGGDIAGVIALYG